MNLFDVCRLLATVATSCLLLQDVAGQELASDPLMGRRVVCIYNNDMYRATDFAPIFVEAESCTHVNYEFAILDPKTYELEPGDAEIDIQRGFFDQALNLKIFNPQLKVLLSLGGWKDSTGKYSELVKDDSKIDNFLEQVVPFLKKHGFDGLDVAWEFPNGWQGNVDVSPSDKPNFAKFLKKVRQKFDEANLLLSISASALKKEITAGYDVPTVSEAVHFINVMTYDMHGPWEGKTGHHSQFEKRDEDEDSFLNMKSAMELWASLGADRMKLNAGIPTYGKTFTLENPQDHGVGSPIIGQGDPGPVSGMHGFMCYHEICKLVNSGKWTEAEDKHHGYYAWSGNQWASYDTPNMVVKKAQWLIDNGFGGVLLKEVGCDDFEGTCRDTKNPLLKMAKMEMIHQLSKGTRRTSSRVSHRNVASTSRVKVSDTANAKSMVSSSAKAEAKSVSKAQTGSDTNAEALSYVLVQDSGSDVVSYVNVSSTTPVSEAKSE